MATESDTPSQPPPSPPPAAVSKEEPKPTAVSDCRFCLKKCAKPLITACACTKLPFSHEDCLAVFVQTTDQPVCGLCGQLFRIKANVDKKASSLARSGDNFDARQPNHEDIYYMVSSLLDRITVSLMLWYFIEYVSPGNLVLLYYLVAHAVLYFIQKLLTNGLRIGQLYSLLVASGDVTSGDVANGAKQQ